MERAYGAAGNGCRAHRTHAVQAVGVNERGVFERILASLHEAALDPARWPGAAALIDEALGTHGNSLACGGGESEKDFRVHYLWIYHRGQRRRDLERIWSGRHLSQDVRLPRLRRLPYNRLFHITDLYTGEELETSEAYNALRTLAHAGNAIDVRLQGPDGSRILWEVNDPVDGEGWSSAQLDRVRRLMPHIRQTACVQQTLTGAHALGATLTELLDTTGVGIIHLDARGRIVAANDRARNVLRTGDSLFDRGGFLFARKPQDDARLQSLLARALPPFGMQAAGGSTTVRRPGAARVAREPRRPARSGIPDVAGRGARAGRRPGEGNLHRSGCGCGRPRPHADGKPGGGAAGPGHDRARDRGGDRPQGEHDPLPREAHAGQARLLAAG